MSGPVQEPELLAGSRSSRLLGGDGAARSWTISIVSTVLVLGGIAFIVVNSPNWPAVRQRFFDGEVLAATAPKIVAAFALNVQLFLTCEVLILPLALLIAVMRLLPGPAFTPVRLIAVALTDILRGVPGILVIFLLAFGLPGLGIPGIPNDEFFWAVVTLTLLYSAYVAEVYRAGIESIHPSQDSAARSLGLSRVQSLRYVVVPQAVRRVIPPLLNDFIGLQKDTALISFIGVVESFSRASIESAGAYNFSPYMVTGALFLLITIPEARLVDWLVARSRRTRMAGIR